MGNKYKLFIEPFDIFNHKKFKYHLNLYEKFKFKLFM